MAKKQILIAEDEVELSAIVIKMLEALGFRGTSAKNAAGTLKALEEKSYDLLLLDLTLPDQNGIDLYKNIIQLHPEYRGRAILTSGFAQTDEVSEIIQRDGLDFLPKPFTLESFRSIITGKFPDE